MLETRLAHLDEETILANAPFTCSLIYQLALSSSDKPTACLATDTPAARLAPGRRSTYTPLYASSG